jgi:CDP-paratose synthetase
MNVLLTGASGFLGSALALKFRRIGYNVSLLLRKESSVKKLIHQRCQFRLARFDSYEEIRQLVRDVKPDVVVHAACNYGRNGESMLELTKINLELGLAIYDALAQIKQPVTFIQAGTSLNPMVSPYALTKHQFKQSADYLATKSGGWFQFIEIRLQHLYGPGDGQEKFASRVLKSCYQNVPILELTKGEQIRDFVYVEDTVNAFITIIQKRDYFLISDQVDVGSGEPTTILDFVKTVHALTKSRTELRFGAIPYRDHEPMKCIADIRRMNALGWKPQFNLVSGLRNIIEQEWREGNEGHHRDF